ncbi:catechol 2,3-dioxygenase-like lactoylglutathione lyase family enzyme [Bradyrhizobium sp. AZCC 1577]|uniref:hypothetical protein n=1 Tax=Bradyrhizobium sp. AZCC 1577 TaxID=3117019 RepID=UPI002FF12126
MAVHFNHTILSARDSKASAKFLTDILNLPAPKHWGPFEMVATENGAFLDYMDTDEIAPQHYAFLVSEAEFDEIFGRVPGTQACLLGRSGAQAARRDQSSRRRTRGLLRGSQRSPPRNHHPPLWQRRMESMTGGGEKWLVRSSFKPFR